ncbi:MAG: sulfurtransferase complex subunit TusC [Methylococcales bacterium]|nr:sulfurtransferase complex subunit TusC [Methylococcales bacterium]
MKSYLFVLRKPAHNGAYLQEMLDIILTTAAFDQSVSILWLDDAVFQLKNQQQPEVLSMKDTAAMFNSLALYDVTDLYIETESLQQRGLSVNALCLPVQALPRKEIGEFMQRFDIVFAG